MALSQVGSGGILGGSQSGPVMNPGAAGYYNQQLGLNLANYGNISSAYQQAQGNAQSQLQGIYAGYGALSQSVLGSLGVTGGGWGVATPAAQQIQRQYTQSQGQNQQNLINSGLGNSTVLSNVMNQGTLGYGQAIGSLGAQLAQTAAGYQSQIGLAGLASQQQGLGQQLGLTSSYLGDISHFNFAPNIPLYGQQSTSYGGGGGGGGGGGRGSGGEAPPSTLGPGVNPYQANAMGYSGGYSYGSGYYGNPNGPGGQQTLNLGVDENADLPTDEQAAPNQGDDE